MNGKIIAIFIAPIAGAPMVECEHVEAMEGQGLAGDRYAIGAGSFSQKTVGKRQVTLINECNFLGTVFNFEHSRRNIIVRGVDLMEVIGKEFAVGDAIFYGEKYCTPCDRPTHLLDWGTSFHETFLERGGLVAQVIKGGTIRKGGPIVTPHRGY